jgi:endonuclease G
MPASADSGLIILRNRAYDCGYAPSLFVARWSAYAFTRTAETGLARHPGSFRADPRVPAAARPVPLDYRGTWTRDLAGFDRGHQAPDATLKVFGPDAQAETYYLSNITPQYSRFNQGFWRELEALTRDWAGDDDTVWVVTGPVFYAGRETLRVGGRGRLAVPHAYFQAVARRRPDRVLAFLVPHRPEAVPWDSAPAFVVGADSVERLTGLKIFPLLTQSPGAGGATPWPGLPTGR